MTGTETMSGGTTTGFGGDVWDAWTLARTELRTQLRTLRSDIRRGLSVAFVVFVFGVFFPLTFFDSAISFGSALANGPFPVGTAGLAFWTVVITAGYIGSVGGFNQDRVGTIGPLVRTSIPPTAVSIGRLATRSIEASSVIVPAGLLLLLGVAVGGGPTAAGLVALAAVPLLVAAFVLGRISGDLIRYANERLQVSLWIKAVLALGLMGAVFVGTQLLLNSQYEPGAAESALGGSVVPGAPLQAYAGVVFAPIGGEGSLLGLFVLGGVLASIPLGLAVAMRLETHMLVRDLGSDAAETAVDGSYGVPDIFEVTPSARVAWRYLLRTRRDPRMLAHLSPLLFGLFGMGVSVFENPGILLLMGPGAAVVGGVIVAGTAYCLNPLGDDRDQLPLLLTSTPSVDVLLRGRMLAGAVLGLVVALGIGTPLALVEYGPAYVVGQSLLAVFLVTVSTGIAVGLGAIAPKFEQREYMNVERAHPSQLALLGLLFGGMIVGIVGILLLFETLSGGDLVAVGLGWLVYLVVLSLGAVGGYRYAVSRMDAFTVDDI